MVRSAWFCVLLTVLSAPAFCAEPSPNLNGKWKLNIAKSDFGPLPAPDSRTDEIEQHGSEIEQSVVSDGPQGKQTFTLLLSVDGKQRVVPPDSPMSHIGTLILEKITASWDGSTLAVSESLKLQGTDVEANNRYDLSENGAVLTITSHAVSPMGQVDRKLVFDREGETALAKAGSVTTTSPAAAAKPSGEPNFTGTWKLESAQSDFGPLPGPASRIDTIEHNDPAIKVNSVQKGTAQGDIDYAFSVTTDGKPSTMNFQGTDATNTAYWAGDILTIDTSTSYQGTDLAIKSLWSLAKDGKILTVNSHYASSLGELDQKLVFVKQ